MTHNTVVVTPHSNTVVTVKPRLKRGPQARRLRRKVAAARMVITERDCLLLQTLAVHHLLTADQIRRLVFPDAQPRRVRRRLRLLFDNNYLARVAVVSQPTRGVPPFVYRLTKRGGEIAAGELGRPVSIPSDTNRSLKFITHHVGVCNFYVTLTEALRKTAWTLSDWQHEWSLKRPSKTGSQRRAEHVYVTDPQTKQEVHLPVLADGFFRLTSGQVTVPYFFEFDRSTHGHDKWRERALAFTAYRNQNRFAKRFGSGEFHYLFVTPRDYRGRSRCDNILGTIQKAVGKTNLFYGSTVEDITPHTILTRIWRPAGSGQRCSLLPAVVAK